MIRRSHSLADLARSSTSPRRHGLGWPAPSAPDPGFLQPPGIFTTRSSLDRHAMRLARLRGPRVGHPGGRPTGRAWPPARMWQSHLGAERQCSSPRSQTPEPHGTAGSPTASATSPIARLMIALQLARLDPAVDRLPGHADPACARRLRHALLQITTNSQPVLGRCAPNSVVPARLPATNRNAGSSHQHHRVVVVPLAPLSRRHVEPKRETHYLHLGVTSDGPLVHGVAP